MAEDGSRVSFSIDGFFAAVKAGFEFALTLFHPILSAFEKVAGEGPLGLLVVFMIFFSLWLLRMGVKTRNSYDFGVGIAGIGAIGLRYTTWYAVLLFLQFAVLPPLVFAFVVTMHSILGIEPGWGRLVELVTTVPNMNGKILGDLLTLYVAPDRYYLPFGWRATLVLLACFATMLGVGRVMVGAAQNKEA